MLLWPTYQPRKLFLIYEFGQQFDIIARKMWICLLLRLIYVGSIFSEPEILMKPLLHFHDKDVAILAANLMQLTE